MKPFRSQELCFGSRDLEEATQVEEESGGAAIELVGVWVDHSLRSRLRLPAAYCTSSCGTSWPMIALTACSKVS